MQRLKNSIVNLCDVKRADFDIRKDGITQGLIMTYLKCRVEFHLRLNEWGVADESKTCFANGSITHDTLDAIYTYYMLHKKLPSVLKIRKWVNNYDKENPTWLGPADKKDIKLRKSLAFVIVSEYMRFYKKDFVEYEILGAENIFDIMWKGFRLRGKKDLRIKIKNKPWILETKTSARISEDDLSDKISFDFQSLFYVHAEEVEYKHEVAGVIYNVIRNPGHKLTAGETLFQFENRLRKEIRKDPRHFYKRWSIPYTKADKMLFRQELLWKLQEIDDFTKGKIKLYRNEKNCITRFRCSFLRACASGKLVGYAKDNKLFTELQEKAQ